VGGAEDIILRNYEAFRRGDIDGVLAGWDRSGEFKPLTTNRTYRGHDEIRQFFTEEEDRLSESDFRVEVVLAQNEDVLVLGSYRARVEDEFDTSVFWIGRVENGKVLSYEAFDDVGKAFAEFRHRLAARSTAR
jgi:ketosteroid isomerase-like protein